MAHLEAKVEIRTCTAAVWIRAMAFIAPVVGVEVAQRWAVAGGWRLVRWRVVGEQKWKRFPRELHTAVARAKA